MTEVFRSEATAALGSFVGQVVVSSIGLTAALFLFTLVRSSIDYSVFYGLGFLAVSILFAVRADRNFIIVKRYVQHPPNYDLEKRHYDEEHNIR